MSEPNDPVRASTDVARHSPLVDCLNVDDPQVVNGVQLTQSAFVTQVNVRADASDQRVMTALSDAFGVALPLQANHCEATPSRHAFWLGPDEWLLLAYDDPMPSTMSAVIVTADAGNSALQGKHIAVTDVSSGQTQITVSGVNAANALRRGCPLDIHPSALTPGTCAQTHINHINVLLWTTPASAGDGDGALSYHLIVRRSFADYLWRWLQQVQSRLSVPAQSLSV